MENVIVVIFQDEKTSYQVLSDLKGRSGQSSILQAGIIQNINGSVVVKDGWADGGRSTSWASGGLLGGLIGILGGPIGMLLGASFGMLVGSTMDTEDIVNENSVLERTALGLKDGHLALIVIADEPDTQELDGFFDYYGPKTLIRHDVASVQAEIYQAEEAAKELKKQAHAKMREEKKVEWKHKAEEVRDKIKGQFDSLKKDHKA